MCTTRTSNLKWRIIFTTFFLIVWIYAFLLCFFDIRETWQRGYGRIKQLLNYTILPTSVPAYPLLLVLPIMLCKKTKVFMITVGMMVLAASTVCFCLTSTIIRERSLSGLDSKLKEDIREKYGHGIANKMTNLIFTQSMDYAQYTFQCCGVNNGDDYLMSNWYNEERGRDNLVPPSCCIPETQTTISNISHSGTPNNVVLRVFYAMLEEGWQNPQPKHEKNCQSSNELRFQTARYTNGCLKSIETWVRMENVNSIILYGVLVLFEIFVIVFCHFMTAENQRREMRDRIRKIEEGNIIDQ